VANDAAVVQKMLVAGLSVAAGGAVTASVAYLIARRHTKALFAPVGPPHAKWDGFGVLGSFFIFALLTQIVQGLLSGFGFFEMLYGPDFPMTLDKEPTAEQKAAAAIRILWSSTYAFVPQIGLIVFLVKRQGGPNPFHFRNLGMNITSGYLTWLLLTPAAFSVFVLANLANNALTGQKPDKHPLAMLGELGGDREWTLLILQTVFLAPVLEELVFRGVLLPWLSRKEMPKNLTAYTVHPFLRTNVVLGLAIAISLMLHINDWEAALQERNTRNIIAQLIPVLFFLAIIPLYWLLPRLHRLRKHLRVRSAQQVRAIVASSALFAAFHATVWPSPIPLFVLSMGLGYLAIRTRSLVGPIVVHGLFNAISALYLLMGGPV
jgi:membrane protease YdiL (CAAX protease family)